MNPVSAHQHLARQFARRNGAVLECRVAHTAGSVQTVLLCILLMISLVSVTLYALNHTQTRPAEDEGLITLNDMQIVTEANQLHLQANAQITLPPTIQAGLDSGVPLTFVLGLRVFEPRAWWLDKTVLDFSRRYKLTYYELTRHYRVHAIDDDVSRNFRSLSSALSGLGELGRISFSLDALQLQQIERPGLVGALEMRLSKSALPLPLQPIIRSSWTLVSEEYRWPAT